jgi:hypothetical protein
MNSISIQVLNYWYLSIAIPITLLTSRISADSLDDLLAPAVNSEKLLDESATEGWAEVVEAFRRNDLAKAKDLGAAFLASDHKTNPYQLLGVRVMMDLANAENPTVNRDVGLSVEMKLLMAERDELRAKHVNLQRVIQDAEATINKLTRNRTQPVQAGTVAYRECARCAEIIGIASKEIEALKPDIEANKVKVGKIEIGANENLKSDTLKLLDMLIEANEIEAAFAITNVYIRVVGSDLDIAKKQQDVVRLQEDLKVATKIVAAIVAEVEPLAATGKGGEAELRLQELMAKVEASGQSDSVKRIAASQLKSLGIRVAGAMQSEKRGQEVDALDSAEFNERLTFLEGKLEAAQTSFGTIIRSIEGFAEYSGEIKGEADRERFATKVQEEIKSGAVSQEKVDNMVKAKAEHVGILREVEILNTQPGISVIQKGRLVNLQATAAEALELLKDITP